MLLRAPAEEDFSGAVTLKRVAILAVVVETGSGNREWKQGLEIGEGDISQISSLQYKDCCTGGRADTTRSCGLRGDEDFAFGETGFFVLGLGVVVSQQ